MENDKRDPNIETRRKDEYVIKCPEGERCRNYKLLVEQIKKAEGRSVKDDESMDSMWAHRFDNAITLFSLEIKGIYKYITLFVTLLGIIIGVVGLSVRSGLTTFTGQYTEMGKTVRAIDNKLEDLVKLSTSTSIRVDSVERHQDEIILKLEKKADK